MVSSNRLMEQLARLSPADCFRAVLPRHPVRLLGVAAVAVAVLSPILLIVHQSFLNGPFFADSVRISLDAYVFVLTDPEFLKALRTSATLAAGMVAIALPLGAFLAFLMTRTDLPGRSWIEPLLLSPVFVSSIVLAFGYTVAIGPVGFVSLWVAELTGTVPWNLYSLSSIIVIAGLSHVPHVYLYVSAALRGLNPDVEEAARTAGAGIWRAAFTVSVPLVMPALVFSGTLLFLLGIEMFGLVLILGDAVGINVLTTYLYKLTNLLGTPSYQLMAVVAVVIIALTAPLVFLQRYALRSSSLYITVRGKGMMTRPLPLGPWRWAAFALVFVWLAFTVFLPLAGILLRSIVSAWGQGISIMEVLTLDNFRELLLYPNLTRGIVNTLLLASVGGLLSVGVYTAVALIAHRWQGRGTQVLDYLVMTPRALPGLIAGLAFLWIFLFVPILTPFRSTLASLWVAYTVVWLAYGMRLVSTTLYQVGPELEEAARVTGASQAKVYRDVTLPLIRYGLLSSWLLIFLTFCREYSTGVYLLGPNTEVIGSMIVSLFAGGDMDMISSLAVLSILQIGIGMAIALRLGVRPHA